MNESSAQSRGRAEAYPFSSEAFECSNVVAHFADNLSLLRVSCIVPLLEVTQIRARLKEPRRECLCLCRCACRHFLGIYMRYKCKLSVGDMIAVACTAIAHTSLCSGQCFF